MDHYDFSKNWQTFLNAWYEPNTQYNLQLDIDKWKSFGLFKNYVLGGPLWKESKAMFWTLKITERAIQLKNHENHLNKFKKTMKNFYNNVNYEKMYYKMCFKDVCKQCEPKENTLEAFIMPQGKHILKNSMLQCAYNIFPNDEISLLDNYTIVIKSKNIKFDINEYYFASLNE